MCRCVQESSLNSIHMYFFIIKFTSPEQKNSTCNKTSNAVSVSVTDCASNEKMYFGFQFVE